MANICYQADISPGEKNQKWQDAGWHSRYLETTKEVLNEGSSVGADRHIAVEFSKAGLGYFSSVFTNILLTQVELQWCAKKEQK
jgi:hypothetical protein